MILTSIIERSSAMSTKHRKMTRAEIVDALVARDGTTCQYPGCGRELDFEATGRYEVTIDHSEPQSWCRANGWTEEEIWSLDNLKLFDKKCNAAKGDLRYLEDGTLPEKPQSRFRFRREKRANRPDGPCATCNNGHNLFVGEVCAQCGCDAQRFPISAKVKASECDHTIWWCWWCSITPDVRPESASIAVLQAESGEWDD